MNNPLILIIDDDKAIRFLLERIFADKFCVKSFGDVIHATAWLDEGNIPHVIICDINMPYISGIEFMLNIHSSGIYGNVPIIMLSSFSQEEAGRKCIEMGAYAYFEKPFDPQELLQVVHKIFGETNS
jgi:DNA-binding NtrC family response regulator